VDAVRARHPDVHTIGLSDNRGGAARNVGVRHAGSPYVAFSDDDSWWAPEALTRAIAILDGNPRLGLVAARVLVGAEEMPDPACAEMAASPLTGDPDLPGKPVLGFIACGAVVRSDAFLDAGGFDARLGVGGEEELLAVDLARAGWALCYVDDVVAHHFPSPVRDRFCRTRSIAANALRVAWLRRRLPGAALRTARILRPALADAAVRAGARDALRDTPWIIRERRPVTKELERALRLLS
jgi:GT2 family glycosyltransferase